MEEEFEVVKRKKDRSSADAKQECMILTEEELKSQENRLNCRRGVGDTVGDLFRVQKDRKEFPKIFQNYKPNSDLQKAAAFAFMKQKPPQVKPVKKEEDLHAIDFSKLSIVVPVSDNEYEPPYAEKTP